MSTTTLKALFISAFVLLFASVSFAGDKDTQCNVMTILAKNDGSGIDPALKTHEALLKQPPFSAFNSFELVKQQSYTLKVGSESKLTIPKPFKGNLKLNSFEKGKLKLTLTLTKKDKKPVKIDGTASPKAPFFAGGYKHKDGTLFFGIDCAKK